MANYFRDNDDLQFYFARGFDWAPLVEVTEYGFRTEGGFKSTAEAVQFYGEVASMVGELAADHVAPAAAAIDRAPVLLENGEAVFPKPLAAIFDRIRDLELHGMCLPRELGGLNCPLILYLVNAELLARGDVSVMAHHSFHGGMAMAMLVFSIQEGTTTFDTARAKILETRFQGPIEEIARGAAWGCMDITEPNAGSDMGALRCKAEQEADGEWRITGQKIFITSGHAKYHFVIARTEKASASDDPFAGLSGLSMFLVPAYEDLPDGTRRRIVTIDRIEEKLGHHGSVTAALSFDRAPAQLIGKRGEGFKYMLTLMNNARLGVGFESIGLCEAAYRSARAYAEERASMGKTIDRHEMIADYLDEMRVDIAAVRALAIDGAFHEEMAQKLAILVRFGDLGEADLKKASAALEDHKRKARRVTPLLKYIAAEKAVEMARRCVQIHGGNGYTKDYGAEKLLRDAMVMPIYEGTSQIQSLMAMKDCLMGILKRPRAFVTRMAQARWRSLSAKDPLERRVARLQSLSLSAQNFLITRTAAKKLKGLQDLPVTSWQDGITKSWDPKKDFALAMLHAERLTRLLTDEAAAERLLAQARRFPERRALLAAFLDRAEPRGRFLHDEITTTGARILEQLGAPRAEAAAE
jgi:alkylation response protein AidB-like acyl-CoA dehydrogenase